MFDPWSSPLGSGGPETVIMPESVLLSWSPPVAPAPSAATIPSRPGFPSMHRFADRLGLGRPFDFRQADMQNLRIRMLHSMCQGRMDMGEP